MCYRSAVIAEVLHFLWYAIGIFGVFCSRDLNLDPMTLYELGPYSLEMRRMSENELPTSKFSKVI